ncbi:alpha/beta hydrolase [Planococcus salinarum]|uniref:Alpha/beta hydrolase n=1 Tax=Planococcus salinarum TaxID=622695 RepID=A0ABX3D1N4_9BACL|nr:alpha/beta hydrolase [Planococcus salinarum]OHX51283.1 alpha/beta hydrolase [Planococcus salinarum]TAA72481.1 alpha/beta hydrolase [Planococcus salinarum]
MKVTKNFIRASDGHEIYYEVYEPENASSHIHLIHGMAEHIARYEEFIFYLTSRGFTVSGHDQRGHGRTSERNGVQGFLAEENGFDRVVEDVREVIGEVQQQIGELPLVLFGHSMGSFVGRRYIQLYSDSIERALFSGTGEDPGGSGKAGIQLAKTSGKINGKSAKSQAISSLVFGPFIKDFKEEGSAFAWLSSDSSEVAKYEADPMSGFVATNQFFVDLFTGMLLVNKEREVAKIRKDLPILLISGSDDPVGHKGKDLFSAARQYKQAGIEEVKVYLGEGARHELLHEVDKERYFSVMGDWMAGDD